MYIKATSTIIKDIVKVAPHTDIKSTLNSCYSSLISVKYSESIIKETNSPNILLRV